MLISDSGIETKINSQNGGVDMFVKNLVRSPHEHVLSSSTKERLTYYQFTVIQFVTGFCHTITEENYEKKLYFLGCGKKV